MSAAALASALRCPLSVRLKITDSSGWLDLLNSTPFMVVTLLDLRLGSFFDCGVKTKAFETIYVISLGGDENGTKFEQVDQLVRLSHCTCGKFMCIIYH
jgi:hypothetical protein